MVPVPCTAVRESLGPVPPPPPAVPAGTADPGKDSEIFFPLEPHPKLLSAASLQDPASLLQLNSPFIPFLR